MHPPACRSVRCLPVTTHPVISRADGKSYPVAVVLENVVVHIQVERLQHGQTSVAVVVHMVAPHNRVVGATVKEQTRVDAIRDMVVGYVHVIATLGRDDAVVA